MKETMKQANKDEYWDIYDSERRLTGRTHRRGDKIQEGDRHLVVVIWIANTAGEFLITRRALCKEGWPGYWETIGGSALAGEDSLTAALREVKEESGILLNPENGKLFFQRTGKTGYHDSWLFRQEFDLADVVLQEGETIDARKATIPEIREMMARGEFIAAKIFPEIELLEALK
jgi:8-oxo-dGTP pyrophosphatase MutT (NUDIX family)